MNIVLIGYRACGKTSIGMGLAQSLNLKFTDVDQITCQRFDGMTIAAIWQKFGEPAWRAAEVKVTQELCAGDNQIIALGGGTIMQPGARQAIADAHARGSTLRVYLRAPAQVLYQRAQGDANSAATRPQFTKGVSGLDEVVQVLKIREPIYFSESDAVIDVDKLSIQEGIQKILDIARAKIK
jgi:shikimate kinase